MNTQVLSSYRLGSRLVSHNKHLVLPFCQPPLCDTDLGTETEPEPPIPPIAQGWATNIGNIDGNEGEGGFNATDSDGNIYVVGRFNQAPPGDPMELYDFDFLNPSQIVQTTIGATLTADPLLGAGSYNIYLAKYDKFGAIIWATKILLDNGDTTVQTVASDITVESGPNPNVYVSISGRATASSLSQTEVEFFNSDGTSYGKLAVPVQSTVLPPLSVREKYGILVKYNSNGDCQWVTKQDNIDDVSGIYQGTDYHSVSISGTNDVILSGRFGASTANPQQTISPPYQLYLYEAVQPATPGGIITPLLYGYLDSNIINSGFVVKYDTNGQITWATKVEMDNNPQETNPQILTRLSSNATSGTDTYILLNMFTAFPIITYYNTDTVTPFPPGGLIPVGTPYILDKSVPLPFPDGVYGNSMYIAKYDANGLFQWSNFIKASPFFGTAVDGLDIKCDQNNGVYVTGTFSNRIQLDSFDPSSPLPVINTTPFAELSTSGSSGGSTGFLLKYNTSGQAEWATQLWAPVFSNIESRAIAIDTNNKVTITGFYNNSALTINSFLNATGPPIAPSTQPSINTTPYGDLAFAPSASNIFVVQYDDNGIVQWATSIANDASGTPPFVYGISTDPNDDSINITGYQSIQLAFNDYLTGVGPAGGPITTSLWGKLPALSTGTDAFIVKYKSNGKVGL
jgi:hypothetical protein